SECRKIAKTPPPGDRATVLEMAEQWDRLADQQERATDLRQGKPKNERRLCRPWGDRRNCSCDRPCGFGVLMGVRGPAWVGPLFWPPQSAASLRGCWCWHRQLQFLHRQRPRRRAAEQSDQLASPHHSITSSTRSRKASETINPIALALLRLTTNS